LASRYLAMYLVRYLEGTLARQLRCIGMHVKNLEQRFQEPQSDAEGVHEQSVRQELQPKGLHKNERAQALLLLGQPLLR